MRARLIFLVVAILVVAGFAAQNWPEFLQTMPLTFGLMVMQAPLGLILLGLLAFTLLAFLVSSASQQATSLIETRNHTKALNAQRDLADKAEASRFTELRHHLDTQLRENRQRETIAAAEFEKAMVQSQRELRAQLEQLNRSIAGRLGEIEGRMEARLDRVNPPTVKV